MARIKKELTELIGGTPLLELSRLSRKHDAKAQVVAKLEYFNPGGSVKDRIALAMIEDAETKGILKPGAVIIEPTSGNTGVGLAWVDNARNHEQGTPEPAESYGSAISTDRRCKRNERSHRKSGRTA